MYNVLTIGDTHCPCMHRKYLDFLQRTRDRFKCDKVVHIGDLVDWATISYHEKSTGLGSPESEFIKAHRQVQKLYEAFPDLTWMIGNHDSLTLRQGLSAGLPPHIFKDYNELWDVPKWEVKPRFSSKVIDKVVYQHGDRGKQGMYASVKNSKDEHLSVVQGHQHAEMGVWYNTAYRGGRTFGMNVGCGVDIEKAAQEYSQKFNRKPNMGCGVVLEGWFPIAVPMKED